MTPHRIDHEEIIQLIPEGASVLDLGCGDGNLLARLVQERRTRGDGVEIDYEKVLECVGRGLSVYHGRIEEGLTLYDDKSFDYVILSETLQILAQPQLVLREMLRVGRRVIVSFPNFANWRLRCQLFFRGVMPMSRVLPFAWYDSPNIHHCTLADFWRLCDQEKVTVETSRYTGSPFSRVAPNLFAEIGIFVLRP